MDESLTIVRALHLGAVVLLFGQFVFVLSVSPAKESTPEFAAITSWSLAVAVLSACAWLGLEALSMSGLPMKEALSGSTISVVLTQTLFGRVWLFRILIAAVLGAGLVATRYRTEPWRRAALRAGGALATILLLSVAASGHAAAGSGLERLTHFCADMLHLLAAGAWLGALVPLVFLFHRSANEPGLKTLRFASQATQRFSTLGVAAMTTLLLSGLINASYMLDDLAALLETDYGRLLVAKIALFALILFLAAINRSVLAPKLASRALNVKRRVRTLHSLSRNAILEMVLGFAVLAIVGKLGITIPAAHVHFH